MSSSYHVFIGNIVSIQRKLIPTNEYPCKCNDKIPVTNYCPDCGRKKEHRIDIDIIDNKVLEPITSIQRDVIHLRTRGVTHEDDIYGEDYSETCMSEAATAVRTEHSPEVQRVLDLGGIYLPRYVILLHSY